MNPWNRVASALGLARVKVAAVVLVALFATAGLGTLGLHLLNSDPRTGLTDHATQARKAGDADVDGLPDVIENRLGSRPDRRDTLGQDVPDGWIYRWFGTATDWNNTASLDQPALVPPTGELPEPLRVPGALQFPTVAAVYAMDAADRPDGTWWTQDKAINPLDWDNDKDGIADAWLLQRGLRLWQVDPNDPAPGDPRYTLREKYAKGLDPSKADTDGDGLTDHAEESGSATFGNRNLQFQKTDPLRYSTRADALPDGYVVRFGLDPHDDGVADLVPTTNGLTVREAFLETERACSKPPTPCDWAQRLAAGPLVDPTAWDSNSDGVPDAWIVRQSHGLLSPLDDAQTTLLDDTTKWDAQPWSGDPLAPAVIVDDANPRPTNPAKATVADYYNHNRPANWDEAALGSWWGGLAPNMTFQDGSLPPAVSLRGWNVTVDPCLGCTTDEGRAEHQTLLPVSADPRLQDTDGDGISDLHEYLGWSTGAIPRTNPFDSDTDGDGLDDAQETGGGTGTDPTRRDSSGGFLTDGEAYAYWTARYAQALADAARSPQDAAITYRFLLPPTAAPGTPVPASLFEKLQPSGKLDGVTANILNDDADGDGYANGAELLPNQYLDLPTTQLRPATDPARKDTDGDGLPDRWEIEWSRTRYFVDCPTGFCVGPEHDFLGWPLNPSRYDSFDPGATEVIHGADSDANRNLKGDSVQATPDLVRPFRNDLAYWYSLNPFIADTSPKDGIPDMFALHWGIEHIPSEVRDIIDDSGDDFSWVTVRAGQLEEKRPKDGGTAPITHVVIDPSFARDGIDLDANLRGMFLDDPKGVWVFDPATGCTPTPLPAGDPRVAGASVPIGCWTWIDYPLGSDLQGKTNPWTVDFDADGLPDAWESHYELDVVGEDVMQSSIDAGCSDPNRLRVFPAAESLHYCLTYAQAYANGLHPNPEPTPVIGDTDQGGLPDWFEIALRDGPGQVDLDPLDKFDDHGEEDWDGDGLLNRVEQTLGSDLLNPDTDHDGLLDGDPLGLEPTPFTAPTNGGGDLCIRSGAGAIQPRPDGTGGMEHRPAFLGADDSGGPMTHTQRRTWFNDLGILSNPNPSRCPQDGHAYYLAKREAMLDKAAVPQPIMLGAGGGTNSTAWDTLGEGIPDGWAIYWRDRGGLSQSIKRALDPTRPGIAQSNPDADRTTLDEYQWGRPADWNEDKNGPWWGGLDPTQRDTDGDAGWFRSVFNGYDDPGGDMDGDADGLPLGIDPFPDADHRNQGTIRRQSDGSYHTDFTQLWPDLEARPGWATADEDADSIPDAIDRAQVTVTAAVLDSGTGPVDRLTIGDATPITVQGRVSTFEPGADRTYLLAEPEDDVGAFDQAAPDQSGVEGATVKVMLCTANPAKPQQCGNGPVAVLGTALTGSNGHYSIAARLTPIVTLDLDGTASIHGTLYEGGPVLFPSQADQIPPGHAKLWVMVEPNDPVLQPLAFAGLPTAQAHKNVDPADSQPTTVQGILPGPGFPLRAARIGENGADLGVTYVKHAAHGIFPAHSALHALDVRAQAKFEDVSVLPGAPRRGDDLLVSGRLLDAAGNPLKDRTVTVDIESANSDLNRVIPVIADGRFATTFLTSDLPVGTLHVRISATLLGSDTYLDPPDPVDSTLLLSQDTQWAPTLEVNGEVRVDREEVKLKAGDDVAFRGTLRESPSGDPVAGRRITAAIRANSVLLSNAEGTTDQDGHVSIDLPALPADTPMQILHLIVAADAVNPSDEPATVTIYLRPLFPTRLNVSDVDGQLGQRLHLKGQLERLAGEEAVAVTGSHGTIKATSSAMPNVVLSTVATDGKGNFTLPLPPGNPSNATWFVTFTPADDSFLQSTAVRANARYIAGTTLTMLESHGTINEPVSFRGRLAWSPADAPVPGHVVNLRWYDGPSAKATTDDHGFFETLLPHRTTNGPNGLTMSFAGNDTLLPSTKFVSVNIRSNTTLKLTASNIDVDWDGATSDSFALQLANETQPLGPREVKLTFNAPDHSSRRLTRLTGEDGTVKLHAADLAFDQAGNWTLDAIYAGTAMEHPARANATFTVTMRVRLVIDRTPAAAFPGDQIQVQGRLDVPNKARHVVPFHATLDGVTAGTGGASGGQPWLLTFSLASNATLGEHSLQVSGGGIPGIVVEGTNASFAVRSSIHAVLDIEELDGARRVEVRFRDEAGQAVLTPVHVVLLRQAPDGRVLGIHDLDTTDGVATMNLTKAQGGAISVLQVDDRLLFLDSVFIQSSLLRPPEPQAAIPIPPWAYVVGAGLALATAIAGALLYRTWHRRLEVDLEAMMRRTSLELANPRFTTEEVIRRAYKGLLQVLANAGYVPRDADTVRSIATSVESSFRLPTGPWRAVSRLFEHVAYSGKGLSVTDRRTAIQAFQALVAFWRGRPKGAPK